MTLERLIKVPVGRAQDGAVVPIAQWQRGQAVWCFQCECELVGKLPQNGISPTPHFAHKVEASCNGEGVVHKATKAAIAQAHASGVLRSLVWSCPSCAGRGWQRTPLAVIAALCQERAPCEGVRSDLLGVDAEDAPRLAIEVVDTHDLEPETLARYEAINLDVFSIKTSEQLVGALVRGAVTELPVEHRSGIVDATRCQACQQILREARARERQRALEAWWNAWLSTWGAIGDWILADLASTERANRRWWSAWSSTWKAIGQEEPRRWQAWTGQWQKIGEEVANLWWSGWMATWRTISSTHQQTPRWWREWDVTWKDLCDRYVTADVLRQKQLAADLACETRRQEGWWPAWCAAWSDICGRVQGKRAFGYPMCPRCRQDLPPRGIEHVCPRPASDTAT